MPKSTFHLGISKFSSRPSCEWIIAPLDLVNWTLVLHFAFMLRCPSFWIPNKHLILDIYYRNSVYIVTQSSEGLSADNL